MPNKMGKQIEDGLLQEVIARAKHAGVKPLHIDTPFRNRPSSGLVGMPDLILIGDPRIIFRELKKDRYQGLSRSQAAVRDQLRALGQDYAIWTPDDLTSGAIDRELTALADRACHTTGTANITAMQDGSPPLGPDGSPLDVDAGQRAFYAAMAEPSSGPRQRSGAKRTEVR